jgi:hypothetical protein
VANVSAPASAQRRNRKRGDRIDERTAEFAESVVSAEMPKPKITKAKDS